MEIINLFFNVYGITKLFVFFDLVNKSILSF